jgi:hypothetical protein
VGIFGERYLYAADLRVHAGSSREGRCEARGPSKGKLRGRRFWRVVSRGLEIVQGWHKSVVGDGEKLRQATATLSLRRLMEIAAG